MQSALGENSSKIAQIFDASASVGGGGRIPSAGIDRGEGGEGWRLPSGGGHHWAQCLVGGVITMATTGAAGGYAMMVDGLGVGSAVVGALVACWVLWARGGFRARVASESVSFLGSAAIAVAVGMAAHLMVAPVFDVVNQTVGRVSEVATRDAGPQPPDVRSVGVLEPMSWLVGVQFGAVLVANWVMVSIRRWLWLRGHLRASVLVYGTDPLAREIAVELALSPQYGVDVAGFVADHPIGGQRGDGGQWQAPLHLPFYAPDQLLDGLVYHHGVEYLVVGPGTVDDETALQLCRWAASMGIVVLVVPRFYRLGMGLGDASVDTARAYPLLRLQRSAHPAMSLAFKRALDLGIAVSFLVLLAPVMILAALAVRVTTSDPVLYAQERVGQHGRPILIYKFRTMTDSTAGDVQWTADARITPIGRLLRRLNIDELPQLYSVVVGDMSLVGPRPERPAFVQRFERRYPDYALRHRMPVGMTGLAQVEGLRGDTSIEERVKYDNLYIDQWSLSLDLALLLRTLGAVVWQRRRAERIVDLTDAVSRDRESGSGRHI